MFRIRAVKESDLADLFELSQLLVFINLPADKNLLKKQINASIKSFTTPDKNLERNYYIFVLEDLKNRKVIGASMIHGKHGTEDEPHYYLKVGQEHKFSKSLNTGFVHGTLKLGLETDGYTEIGGLVLHPDFRGNPNKLGKSLSFVRFLYMAFHLDKFTEYIHSELMPPLDSHGNSPLWEAIGRRFMNMDYVEADLLSRENKEFILNLFPSDTIYGTLLTPEARNAIGKVGDQTKPVKKMLESIGFHYTDEVDPFDGGPHYRAKKENITPIANRFEGTIKISDSESLDQKMIITTADEMNDFCAVPVNGILQNNQIIISKEDAQTHQLKDGQKSKGIFI
ncbi:MAG: arginine N-succinyltransferase [Oligoflexia bacterium]|nr:arginine N-succinyltransferase [Oligoflexia bacterium]